MGTRRPNRPFGIETKAALVEAARRIIEEGGLEALSVRAVAEAAGVSAATPYWFFPGRTPELMAAIASTGFVDLIDELDVRDMGKDPLGGLVEVVSRYVRFGARNPHLYRVMFHRSLIEGLSSLEAGALDKSSGVDTYQELHALKVHAFELIVAPLERLEQAGALRTRSSTDAALAVAAIAHGLVGEFIDEGLGSRDARPDGWSTSRGEMTRLVTDVLVHGIARA
jgi:AcrR family transcriptional regulator